MRKPRIGLAAVALVAVGALVAQAACDFDGAANAKGMKTSFVRAFEPCLYTSPSPPNSSTGSGIASCAPPAYYSPDGEWSHYFFDNKKGGCSFQAKFKVEDPCSDGSGTACLNGAMKAKCAGIMESDQATPISNAGWALVLTLRYTVDDPDNGSMTYGDLPIAQTVPFPFELMLPLQNVSDGSLSLKTDLNSTLASLGLAALPACSQVEFVRIAITDPSGYRFAVPGFGAHP